MMYKTRAGNPLFDAIIDDPLGAVIELWKAFIDRILNVS